ncbi:oligopeptidase PepB [Peptostreptococcus russellii]|uniref:Oligopeptidase F n=1 Tax=Peptostreptococcus russellii TaxID=215200 RepID=A0A2P7Q292_9FIRM|nr:oligoendopeptidase F [Peptostreptococcus russellii]PSJ32070.1 oligopeptidase PepB [Peptostreptococcus russellii]
MAKNRKEIENKYKWNLEKMYLDSSKIEEDIKFIEKSYEDIKEYKGKMSNSAENFYNSLKIMEDSSRRLSYLYAYTHMKHHEDTRINENLADATKSEMIASELGKATAFIVPEIIGMDSSLLETFLKDERIAPYKKMIDEILRDKPYTLSEKEEELMAAVSDLTGVAENTYEMLSYADMKFPEIEDEKGEKVRLDHFNYSTYIKSKNQRVRKDAFEAEFGTYKKYSNTMASTLFGAIKSEIFNAKTRKYPSALFASLYQDNISVDVYNNLIDSIHENIPALDKYLEIKKKYLGLEELHMYDLYVPMARDFNMEISYEEAKKIILEALKPMGEGYTSLIQKAFDERWIDVYENEGKKGGAYSWGCYDSHPYILMSYNNDLNSMFTLIHELGHSIHSYLSHNSQPYIYSSYKIFVAEVASTVNETLLIKYLLNNSKDKTEQIYLLNYYLEQFRTTVYRQTLFAEFEKITHEKVEAGNPMTADDFTEVFYNLNKLYYGGACNVDEISGVEWARIPHFYSNFYVYKYATGFAAASVLSEKILNEDGAVEKYLEFLKSGGSEYPLDQLRSAGVDMEKKESVDGALKIFNELTEKLEELVK